MRASATRRPGRSTAYRRARAPPRELPTRIIGSQNQTVEQLGHGIEQPLGGQPAGRSLAEPVPRQIERHQPTGVRKHAGEQRSKSGGGRAEPMQQDDRRERDRSPRVVHVQRPGFRRDQEALEAAAVQHEAGPVLDHATTNPISYPWSRLTIPPACHHEARRLQLGTPPPVARGGQSRRCPSGRPVGSAPAYPKRVMLSPMVAAAGAQMTTAPSGCPAMCNGVFGPAKLLTTRLARRDPQRTARRSMPGATLPATLMRLSGDSRLPTRPQDRPCRARWLPAALADRRRRQGGIRIRKRSGSRARQRRLRTAPPPAAARGPIAGSAP